MSGPKNESEGNLIGAALAIPTMGLSVPIMNKWGMDNRKKAEGDALDAADTQTRDSIRSKVLSDPKLDQQTKNELVKQSNVYHGDSQLQSMYEQATTGVGVYGVRLLNKERTQLMMQKPGKRAAMLTGANAGPNSALYSEIS